MTGPVQTDRPTAGLTALSGFFALGAVISGVSGVALVTPGGRLEGMWRLNPPAPDAFLTMGPRAVVLMGAVSIMCALASLGLRRRARWGCRLALVILAVNLVGDLGNAAFRGDLRTLIGLAIGAGLIAYLLSARVRANIR